MHDNSFNQIKPVISLLVLIKSIKKNNIIFMKKTIFLAAFSTLVGLTAVSAQTEKETITTNANNANGQIMSRESEISELRDSASRVRALRDNEQKNLNNDYKAVKGDYNENKRLARKELNGKSSAEALAKYNMDKEEFYQDKRQLRKQRRTFNHAKSDGVITPEERAHMRAKYEQDKKHYIKNKRQLERQKKEVRDNRPN